MKQALKMFLEKHVDEIYYSFAFTCNYEYAEILLGLNTEEEFKETLNEYQNGAFN